jgi:predicted Zn finger-like uncharacterized protein
MIIPCPQCGTKFRANPALIKETGTIVRCSNCQAVFTFFPDPQGGDSDPDSLDRRLDGIYRSEGDPGAEAPAGFPPRLKARPPRPAENNPISLIKVNGDDFTVSGDGVPARQARDDAPPRFSPDSDLGLDYDPAALPPPPPPGQPAGPPPGGPPHAPWPPRPAPPGQLGPQPGQPYPVPPYPGQPFPGQNQPGQGHPVQNQPGQNFPGQNYPAPPQPGQPLDGPPPIGAVSGPPVPAQGAPGQSPPGAADPAAPLRAPKAGLKGRQKALLLLLSVLLTALVVATLLRHLGRDASLPEAPAPAPSSAEAGVAAPVPAGEAGSLGGADLTRLSLINDDNTYHYLNHPQAGQLLVVAGRLRNSFDAPVSHVRVKASLKNGQGRVVAERQVFAGNYLTEDLIKSLTMQEILARLSLRGGQDGANLNIPPGQEVPFMLVFDKIPPDAAEYVIEPVGFTPSAGR